MGPTENKQSDPRGNPSNRWTNILLAIATIAAVSGIVAMLLRPQPNPGVEIALPTPTPSPSLMVYVSGALAHPGVYEFQKGDRLQDVVETAGGFLSDVDTSGVNLATLLEDEQHYHFPSVGESPTLTTNPLPAAATEDQAPTPESPSTDTPININTAPLAELQLLPGIGAVKAEAIVEFRSSYGPFAEPAEITNVPGIGPATLENIQHLITAELPSP